MTTTHFVTIDDLERNGTPDGQWELIDGELVPVNPTGEEHNDIVSTMIIRLGSHVTARKLGKLVMPDAGVVVDAVSQTVRSPDVGFIRADRLPGSGKRLGFFRVVPDLVVEVRSRSDSRSELMAKGLMWLQAGASLVWLVDPITATATELRRGRAPRELTPGESLDGGEIVPGFSLPLRELFAS